MRCHSRQPWIIQRSIPGPSALSFSRRSRSRSSGGMVTVNGSRFMRRRMDSSTERKLGLWLPAIKSLNCGLNSK